MSRKNTEAEAILPRDREAQRKQQWYIENKQRITHMRRIRIGANKINSIWTPERHSELLALFNKKLPLAEIGRRMGLTKNTIVGRVHRLGLSGGYCGPTTMDRLNMLNAAWAKRNGTTDKFPT